MSTKNIQSFKSIKKEFETLKMNMRIDLCNAIEKLPQNPNTKEINSKCYIIRASELIGNPWTPSYHNFRFQYEKIIQGLETCDDPINYLENIFKKGVVVILNKYINHQGKIKTLQETVKLHPTVIEHLRQML